MHSYCKLNDYLKIHEFKGSNTIYEKDWFKLIYEYHMLERYRTDDTFNTKQSK